MKLRRLSVQQFRGIRSLSLTLNGKSTVVIGANGTGKSSLVDALDFLLTGSVRRLTGEGAGGISLAKHGRHIDATLESSFVEAEFTSDLTSGSTVVLRRTMADPNHLGASGAIPLDVQRFLDLAQSGAHHLLTRREILKYILTEPAQRFRQVASLLQLSELDSLRRQIQGASRDAQDAFRQADAVRRTRLDSVLRSFNPPAESTADLLARTNSHRRLLGGDPLPAFELAALRRDLIPPSIAANSPLQSHRTKELLESIEQWLSVGHTKVAERAAKYLDGISGLRKDGASVKALSAADLISRGLNLVATDECPLCLAEWNQEELQQFLNRRLAAAADARRVLRALAEERVQIRAQITSIQSVVRSLAAAVEASLPQISGRLATYSNALDFYAGQLLIEPVVGNPPEAEARTRAEGQLAPAGIIRDVRTLRETASALPDLTGAQQAWDELTGLERAIVDFREARAGADVCKRAASQLAALDKLFLEARDQVLQATYDAIAGRLTDLYRRLHGQDEAQFQASISPTRAGLKLEVDFFGRGSHPPSALHSEGHQDSMGVCLFLALTEYLTGGHVPLLILDDVLMSVDQGHRRAVAEVLRDEFRDVQFVITTHDRVWWRQLQSLGVVARETAFEIRQWSIDDGPTLIENAGRMLAGAQAALTAGDVPRAAHQLRRAVEIHFRDICDGLGAPVRFRGDGSYGAGEFVLAANKRLAELLRLAKQAATSWGRSVDSIDQLDAARAQVSRSFSEENWAVNPNIHYNDWADFSPEDFRGVLDAYTELFALYVCRTCGSTLWITEDGVKPTGLRCACGEIGLTLVRRPTQ